MTDPPLLTRGELLRRTELADARDALPLENPVRATLFACGLLLVDAGYLGVFGDARWVCATVAGAAVLLGTGVWSARRMDRALRSAGLVCPRCGATLPPPRSEDDPFLRTGVCPGCGGWVLRDPAAPAAADRPARRLPPMTALGEDLTREWKGR